MTNLFHEIFITVTKLFCPNCSTTVQYDGQEDCVLHTERAVISYDILFEFYLLFTKTRLNLLISTINILYFKPL